MRASFVPDYSLDNPYQWELARALGREGVRVSLHDGMSAAAKRGTTDVIHIHWTHEFLRGGSSWTRLWNAVRFLWSAFVARRRGVAIVWTVHNLFDHEGQHRRSERAFGRILVSLSDRIIVHCGTAADLVAEAYGVKAAVGRKAEVVPHGNYVESYPNEIDRLAARASLHLPETARVFLFIGQIRRYKGIDALIKDFCSVDLPEAQLVLAGAVREGEDHRALSAAIDADPRISAHFRFIDDDELQVFLNAADVVVLPYRDVLTSGSAVLAMSFGKALVAPRVGCLAESLPSDGAILYDPTRPDGLRAALQEAMTADLAPMGRANLERALEAGWDKVGKETAQIYRSIRPDVRVDEPFPLGDDPVSHRRHKVMSAALSAVPSGAPFALIDEGMWGVTDEVEGRRVERFLFATGEYWGGPWTEDNALAEVDRLRRDGVRHLVVSDPASWWLRAYPRFRRRLRGYRTVLQTERVTVFDLGTRRRSWGLR